MKCLFLCHSGEWVCCGQNYHHSACKWWCCRGCLHHWNCALLDTQQKEEWWESYSYMTLQNCIYLFYFLFDQHAIVSAVAPAWGDTTTTDQSETASEAPSTPVSDFPAQMQTPKPKGGKKHHFVSKTVRLCSCLSYTRDLRFLPIAKV